jgi:hypothetical protein
MKRVPSRYTGYGVPLSLSTTMMAVTAVSTGIRNGLPPLRRYSQTAAI